MLMKRTMKRAINGMCVDEVRDGGTSSFSSYSSLSTSLVDVEFVRGLYEFFCKEREENSFFITVQYESDKQVGPKKIKNYDMGRVS
jgi:hypothetical protein